MDYVRKRKHRCNITGESDESLASHDLSCAAGGHLSEIVQHIIIQNLRLFAFVRSFIVSIGAQMITRQKGASEPLAHPEGAKISDFHKMNSRSYESYVSLLES